MSHQQLRYGAAKDMVGPLEEVGEHVFKCGNVGSSEIAYLVVEAGHLWEVRTCVEVEDEGVGDLKLLLFFTDRHILDQEDDKLEEVYGGPDVQILNFAPSGAEVAHLPQNATSVLIEERCIKYGKFHLTWWSLLWISRNCAQDHLRFIGM